MEVWYRSQFAPNTSTPHAFHISHTAVSVTHSQFRYPDENEKRIHFLSSYRHPIPSTTGRWDIRHPVKQVVCRIDMSHSSLCTIFWIVPIHAGPRISYYVLRLPSKGNLVLLYRVPVVGRRYCIYRILVLPVGVRARYRYNYLIRMHAR